MKKCERDQMMLNAIRISGLEKYVSVVKKDLLFEYLTCYADDQSFITNFFIMIGTLYTFRNELNDAERLILDKYESMLDSLRQKCLRKELNDTERIMFALILTESLVNNCYVNLSDFSLYISNVYSMGYIYYEKEEIFLILANTLNTLNREYNSDVFLVFDEYKDNICSYRYENGRREIVVGGTLINIIKRFANKKSIAYYSIVYYVVFTIMHEFYHSLQFPCGIQNSLIVDNPIYKKEGLVALFQRDFYEQFHNNFSFEIDADNFAISNMDSILVDLMEKKSIKKSELRVNCAKRINRCKNKLNDEEFTRRLNQEYKRLCINLNDKGSDYNGGNKSGNS